MARAVVNRALAVGDVRAQDGADARAFHDGLAGYAPTPVRELEPGRVWMKDESARLGLPAFKVLGASWAVERALREVAAAGETVHTLVAASAGNHGRAVAHVAALRGLAGRIFLPARSAAARRAAIASEGAEVVVVDGGYEEAVAESVAAGEQDGVLEIADVGDSGPARWVVDGYATLFAELGDVDAYDLIIVPVGVGSLGAAAARYGAAAGISVVAAEPTTAACLAASLEAGEPTTIVTPGTTMAGLDCAEVSAYAWPDLRAGIAGAIAVSDFEVHGAMADLAARGYAIGDSGAAPLAALRALREDPECGALRDAVGFDDGATRVLLVATEGVTDPEGYAGVVARA
ncbi:pyridoxal-phosphate dependent enzyme [Baekduia sp. Peel2402]|uniref:pyridoxal-phosphate dependent enzyme n=1 Tax=Baekduia sp. Peel2402 TaxID=3458296 RepID=UPI00403ED8A0